MGEISRSQAGPKNKLVVLTFIHLKTIFYNLMYGIEDIFLYYRNLSFFKIDLLLKALYFFHTPYKVSKKFLQERGSTDLYLYGETPLTTMDSIAKECRILSKDIVYELGCGRGRSAFW